MSIKSIIAEIIKRPIAAFIILFIIIIASIFSIRSAHASTHAAVKTPRVFAQAHFKVAKPAFVHSSTTFAEHVNRLDHGHAAFASVHFLNDAHFRDFDPALGHSEQALVA